MTNLNSPPFQLCVDETSGWLYYSSDTINWTISTIRNINIKGVYAIAISGSNAIGVGYYNDLAATQTLIYSIDGGRK